MAADTARTLTASRAKTLVIYGVMITSAVGLYFLIRELGLGLTAPPPATPAGQLTAPARGSSEALPHVLLAMVVVIVSARSLGALFHYVRQPPVMGEVVAGILLGPSLLGRVAPDVSAYLLPASVAPYLGMIAQVGVVLFMFLVGLELDTSLLRRKTHSTLAISHAGIIAPFLLGATAALLVYPRLSSSDVPFGTFCLFLGLSMSVTAFPVLARILTDFQLQKTQLGVVAISCAAVGDVTAWCLLALVVSVAQSTLGSAWRTAVLSVGYVLGVVLLVRPLLLRLVRTQDVRHHLSTRTIATVFVALLLSAFTTELIGIHALFGAFLVGAIIPHDSFLARALKLRLEDVVVVLLLPMFFAFTGMRTEIGLVRGFGDWAICGALLAAAVVGKFGGSAVVARLSGLGWRDSASVGVLMNTRGLMELIVLNIGLDLKVISPTLFAMLVIMAIVTTLATAPVLQVLLVDRAPGERSAEADTERLAHSARYARGGRSSPATGR